MNILPKKSWHVLSRDNIKKVRKDEAEAREKERELARRAAIAEQEAKIEFMRKRSHAGQQESEQREETTKRRNTTDTILSDGGHINFFSDLQTGIGLEGATNVDHEKEKKEEQEKWEKKVGILNYLVDKDSSAHDPWYLKKGAKPSEKKSVDKRSIPDPLVEMKGYLDTKKKLMEDSVPSTPSSVAATSKHKTVVVAQDEYEHKKYEHKKKHKKKHKEEKKQLLQKLREERKRRENEERAKAEKLLKKHHGLEDEQPVTKTIEEIPGRYNSQYNPHLARNRRN